MVNGSLLVGKSAILLEGDTVALRGVHQGTSLSPAFDLALDGWVLGKPDFRSRSSEFTLRLPPNDASLAVISSTPTHLDSPTLKLGAYTVNTSVVLGSGSFGVVRLGQHPVKGQVAVKSVVKNRVRPLSHPPAHLYDTRPRGARCGLNRSGPRMTSAGSGTRSRSARSSPTRTSTASSARLTTESTITSSCSCTSLSLFLSSASEGPLCK